ncbi:hypothetical protein HMPREF1880_01513 [Streptococcus agalactiae]|nr:hypothetical protein HMPREF1880_01513 [Streptococcus agalactiae]
MKSTGHDLAKELLMWSETKLNSSFGMSISFVNEGKGDKTCQLMNKIKFQNTLQKAIVMKKPTMIFLVKKGKFLFQS